MRLNTNYTTTYKKEAIKTAEQLQYGPIVIAKLEKAKDEREISRILVDARRGVI